MTIPFVGDAPKAAPAATVPVLDEPGPRAAVAFCARHAAAANISPARVEIANCCTFTKLTFAAASQSNGSCRRTQLLGRYPAVQLALRSSAGSGEAGQVSGSHLAVMLCAQQFRLGGQEACLSLQ